MLSITQTKILSITAIALVIAAGIILTEMLRDDKESGSDLDEVLDELYDHGGIINFDHNSRECNSAGGYSDHRYVSVPIGTKVSISDGFLILPDTYGCPGKAYSLSIISSIIVNS